VDVVSVHFYPQGGEFSDDVSDQMQLLRNRSTRQLWDPNYVSESWINQPVYLIPRIRLDRGRLLVRNARGADGIQLGRRRLHQRRDDAGRHRWHLGQQGLDMATRWTVPDSSTPTYKAMQMYRNYDGAGSAFGDTSISASAPNPTISPLSRLCAAATTP